jgi:hypothetical protein
MAVFWIITSVLNNGGKNIAYALEVTHVDTTSDLKACLVKDGVICGVRLDFRREGGAACRVIGRRPTLLTLSGLAEARLADWTFIGEKTDAVDQDRDL